MAEVPVLHVPAVAFAPVPAGGGGVCTLWQVGGPLRRDRLGMVNLRYNDDFLFGACALAESDVPEGGPSGIAPLQAATDILYRAMFGALAERGFASLLRVWNYIPDINRETHGLERYRQFNAGRQKAFAALGHSTTGKVPAASALGMEGEDLQLAFLACRAPIKYVENPRQISAYHYPPEYGEKRPIFSRAALVEVGGDPLLFVSGTASIIGCRSCHLGNAAAQTRESLLNISAVVAAAGRAVEIRHSDRFSLDRLAYTIYIRRGTDQDAVRREFRRIVGDQAPALFVQADICRADLLVEIEASGGHELSWDEETMAFPEEGQAPTAEANGATPALSLSCSEWP